MSQSATKPASKPEPQPAPPSAQQEAQHFSSLSDLSKLLMRTGI